MSSATNHRKRSHRSEQYKGAAFRAQTNRALYRVARDSSNRSVLSRITSMFHRRALKPNTPQKEVSANENH